MLRKLSKVIVLFFVLALIGSTNVFAEPAGKASFMTATVSKDAPMRNDYGGYIGVRFNVTSEITVTTLGRPDILENYPMSQDHEIVIFDVETNRRIARVTVTPSSPIENGYRYENLSQPVTLRAGNKYTICSAEFVEGDYWAASYNMTDVHSNEVMALKAISSVFASTTAGQPTWMPTPDNNLANESNGYIGLNFWYIGESNVTVTSEEPVSSFTIPKWTPPVSSAAASTPDSDNGDESDGGMNPLVIAGICVGGIVIAFGVFFLVLGKKKTDDSNKKSRI